MDNINDFKIEDGVLVKYTGNGGDIIIPEGVKSLGDEVFKGRVDITSVVIPCGVECIESEVFEGCEALERVTFPDRGLHHIGQYAFSGCASLREAVIPDGVKWLGYGAFCACKKMERAVMPDSIRSIGWYAFAECKLLGEVVISTGIDTVEVGVFEDCPALTEVDIPNGVTAISDYAFYGCKSLRKAVIPESVERMGGDVFTGCSALKELFIPKGVIELEGVLASDCASLEKFEVDADNPVYAVFDGNLYSKDGRRFISYACGKKEKKFSIPEGVTHVFEEAFSYCANLEEIFIPASAEQIEFGAFIGCKALERICVSAENPYYKELDGNLYTRDASALIAYAYGRKNTAFTVPDTVTNIGKYTFDDCKRLAEIVIPEGVTEIRHRTFYRCSGLKKLVLPDSITHIDDMAFYDKQSAFMLICSEKVVQLMERVFCMLGDRGVRELSIGGFWKEWKDGKLSEEEAEEWLDFIKENPVASLRAMKDNADFFDFVLGRKWLSWEEADRVIEFTSSLECRAMLLDMKRSKNER